MKSVFLFLLALFALGQAQDANNECSEAMVEPRVFECLWNINVTLLTGDPTEEEACAEVKTFQHCFETVIDECLDDEQRVEADKELQQMTERLGVNCSNTALGQAQDANDECSEARVEARVFDCLGNIMVTLLADDPTEEEACAEVKTLQNCLENVIDECLDDEQRVEVDKELQQITEMLGTNCPNTDDNDEAEACAEDNKDYLMECLTENQLNAIAQLGSNSNLNANHFKCTLYSLIADCITQRVEEKCGETARDIMREELNDPPQEIKDACDAADDIVLTDFESLLTKKKK